MWDKFGEFDSAEELNRAAAAQKAEGDREALIMLAEENGIDYAVDIYPFYGSDVEATLKAGYDIRHALIGPGVFASHGYERSHKKGVLSTLKLLDAFVG